MKSYKVYYKNSKNDNWPKRYRSEFIEPGICSYNDMGAGVIYISSETLDKMNNSFIGKPVVNIEHNDLTAEEAFKLSNENPESIADGVVYDVGTLPNGWRYCDMIIWDKDTQKNIASGNYSVSCAYHVDEVGPGGKYHEITYDEEVLNGTYTHNAIVDNPRYEGAKIYELPATIQNSVADEILKKYNKGVIMKDKVNIFKQVLNSVKNQEKKPEDEKEDKSNEVEKEEMQNMEGAFIEVNGEKIPLEEAIKAYMSAKGGPMENVLNAEDEVDVDGEKVMVSELIAACEQMKQNAEPSQDETAETIVEEQSTVTNSKKKDPKKYFKIVKNAAQREEDTPIVLNTRVDRLKRGTDRYGKKEKNNG